jgi:hypothetical protein
MSQRLKHIASGIFVLGGFIIAALTIATAARGIHGYLDVFEMLAWLSYALIFVRWGWAISE